MSVLELCDPAIFEAVANDKYVRSSIIDPEVLFNISNPSGRTGDMRHMRAASVRRLEQTR